MQDIIDTIENMFFGKESAVTIRHDNLVFYLYCKDQIAFISQMRIDGFSHDKSSEICCAILVALAESYPEELPKGCIFIKSYSYEEKHKLTNILDAIIKAHSVLFFLLCTYFSSFLVVLT